MKKSNDLISQFEIYQINPGIVVGCELEKERRYIVISNNLNNRYSDSVTLIPIKKIDKTFRYEIEVKCGEMNLYKNSKIVIPQILTVGKDKFINKDLCLGKVPFYIQKQMEHKLIEFLSFDENRNKTFKQIKQYGIYEINFSANQSVFSQDDLVKVIVVSNNINNASNEVVAIVPINEYDTSLKTSRLDIKIPRLYIENDNNNKNDYIAYPEKIIRVAKERFFINGRIRKIGKLPNEIKYMVKNSLFAHFGF